MTTVRNPLIEALRDPRTVIGFSIADWNLLLRQTRGQRSTARLGYLLEDARLTDACPPRLVEITQAARAFADFHQVQIRREVRRIGRAIAGLDADPILLKGAAYLAASLPFARGRHMADVDILVPRERLPAVEARLVEQGWKPQQLDSYDQRYYREWMHEIPPLRHPESGIEVDVHHSLVPLTARVHPDPGLLRDASVRLPEGPFRVLAPVDMVLHSATHLFYGEIKGSLRDLVDLGQMLTCFGSEPGFWEDLLDRAERLGLTMPLYYALRLCRDLLATQVPRAALQGLDRRGAPPAATRWLVTLLAERVLTPPLPGASGAPVASWLLYVRSHWLRMPPGLLTSHLIRKAWRRLGGSVTQD